MRQTATNTNSAPVDLLALTQEIFGPGGHHLDSDNRLHERYGTLEEAAEGVCWRIKNRGVKSAEIVFSGAEYSDCACFPDACEGATGSAYIDGTLYIDGESVCAITLMADKIDGGYSIPYENSKRSLDALVASTTASDTFYIEADSSGREHAIFEDLGDLHGIVLGAVKGTTLDTEAKVEIDCDGIEFVDGLWDDAHREATGKATIKGVYHAHGRSTEFTLKADNLGAELSFPINGSKRSLCEVATAA